MNTMQTDNQWFIARDGQQHGPISDVEIRKLAELGHLRASDLVWRQGFPDWRPAVAVFPPPQGHAPAPQAPAQSPAPAAGHGQAPAQKQPEYAPQAYQPVAAQPSADVGTQHNASRPAGTTRPSTIVEPRAYTQPTAQHSGATAPHAAHREPLQPFDSAPTPSSRGKRVAIAALVAAILGGAAYGLLTVSRDPNSASIMLPGGKPTLPALPPSTVNPALDQRLQAIPAWQTLKRHFPEWYEERLKEAEGLTAQGTTDAELDKHLVGELVKLRRKSAKDALAVPAEGLKAMATAFLDNLVALEKYGVPACYAFISRGEITGVVVEMLQTPDKGPTINHQVVTVFESAAAGRKNPVKHEAAQKPDYDVLAAELSKLGWSQGDMQLFADPRALGAAPPSRVCTMVQEWFRAHLAVADPAIQERLLFETLKPVVGG